MRLEVALFWLNFSFRRGSHFQGFQMHSIHNLLLETGLELQPVFKVQVLNPRSRGAHSKTQPVFINSAKRNSSPRGKLVLRHVVRGAKGGQAKLFTLHPSSTNLHVAPLVQFFFYPLLLVYDPPFPNWSHDASIIVPQHTSMPPKTACLNV